MLVRMILLTLGMYLSKKGGTAPLNDSASILSQTGDCHLNSVTCPVYTLSWYLLMMIYQ